MQRKVQQAPIVLSSLSVCVCVLSMRVHVCLYLLLKGPHVGCIVVHTYVRLSALLSLPLPAPVCIREDEPYSTKGLDDQSKAVLEKVRANTREEYLKKGSATGSVRASDRLMRELMDIYRSNSYKNGKIHTHLL